MEKQINTKEIYNGKVIRVTLDEVELDDKTRSLREVVHHRGGVCIALLDEDDDSFYMVRQYRYALGKQMLEFPAGKIEKDEDIYDAINREAEEETGYKAKELEYYGYIIPTCGYDNEKIHLFYGKKGERVGQHLDKDERIELEKHSYKEIEAMIKDNIIDDSKTIALMYKLKINGKD